MNQKDAKNIFELTNKLETEYTHVISDVIQVKLRYSVDRVDYNMCSVITKTLIILHTAAAMSNVRHN